MIGIDISELNLKYFNRTNPFTIITLIYIIHTDIHTSPQKTLFGLWNKKMNSIDNSNFKMLTKTLLSARINMESVKK